MYEELIEWLTTHAESYEEMFGKGETSIMMRQAVDAIEELNKQIKNWEVALKTALDYIPCWIPVTEKLPNVDTNKSGYETTTVLVAVQDWKNAQPMAYQRACVRDKTVYRWKWVWGKIYDGPPITHWMPLPEPPKEEV